MKTPNCVHCNNSTEFFETDNDKGYYYCPNCYADTGIEHNEENKGKLDAVLTTINVNIEDIQLALDAGNLDVIDYAVRLQEIANDLTKILAGLKL